MPDASQLAHIAPVPGDGASVVREEDGSVQTSWPDGTSRTDEADGRVQVLFPDFSCLNIETDGTRTLHDAAGKPLDPTSGLPLDDTTQEPLPTPGPTTVDQLQEIVDGASSIADLAASQGILRAFHVAGIVDQKYGALAELASAFGEALKGEISPATWFQQPLRMLLAIVKAIETPQRGCKMRSWCYTVVYDAMGMGDPPEPLFSGNLQGPEQDALNKAWWDEGRSSAHERLADGQAGIALRNRVLLLIAKCGGDPARAVTELWAAACRESGDDGGGGLLAAYDSLDWPQPTGG